MFFELLILRTLKQVLHNQELTLHQQERIMATISDLEAAIDSITAEVATLGTDVKTVLDLLTAAQGQGADIPQDAIDKLGAISASLTSVDASLKAVEPPPTPTP